MKNRHYKKMYFVNVVSIGRSEVTGLKQQVDQR